MDEFLLDWCFLMLLVYVYVVLGVARLIRHV
jgi:hypothetical protein